MSVRKALKIKDNGRSSDFITPSFIWGCGYKCSYCTMRRYKPEGFDIASNIDQIINIILDHSLSLGKKMPNQVDEDFWVYEIGCNSDMALHAKHYDWKKVFDFFKYGINIKATFATKYVNRNLLTYYPRRKVRIRFSLMPQNMSTIYEPKTSLIIDRIKAVDEFCKAGYDVHLNFSPVIAYKGGLNDYRKLFELVDKYVSYKDQVKAEVIFLTHNEKLHQYNVQNNIPGEDLLWQPDLQEPKISSYGSSNVRYKNKKAIISLWKVLHDEIIPWNTIRYIF